MVHPHDPPSVSTTGRLVRYGILLLLVIGPIAVLGYYADEQASRTMDKLIHGSSQSTAQITATLIRQDIHHHLGVIRSIAREPAFIDSVEQGAEVDIRERLGAAVQSYPRLIRTFVTDPEGLLWSDYPRAPESLGKVFAHRDWYRGVSREWSPYVSEVYRRHAEPQLLLVAAAVPVRGRDGERVLGALVCQISLEGLTELLGHVDVGEHGSVFLVDHRGVIVSHPHLDLQARRHAEFAEVEAIRDARAEPGSPVSFVDPISGELVHASVRSFDILGQEWLVIAQQPLRDAFAAERMFTWQLIAAVSLIAAITAIAFLFAARHQDRVYRLNGRLREENGDRLRAERALKAANENLEQIVQQRTEELRQKDEQLLQAQKMESIGRLAGGVAHDFNNLLFVINGYAEVVRNELDEGNRHHGRMGEIIKAGERAGDLTKQLLAFSRKQVLKPEVLDLNTVVGRMDGLLRRLIGENIDIRTLLDSDLHPVRFDPGQIEQIIMNLAVNARDAMPEGGKLTIETANVVLDEEYVRSHADARPGPHVMLAISDAGHGMDAATRDRIFEPFFTTKDEKGTGLGLATVYGIVKQSGGNIWVYSEPERGTTFKIYLPAAEGAELPEASPESPVEVQRGSGTILVVEDEESVRGLVRLILGETGYQVLEAADGERAIELCREHEGEIHLLLTDVVLPGVSGPKLAEEIQQLRPDIKVVYMSGYTDNAIVHHGMLDEGIAFLEKPIKPRVLTESMRRYLSE